MNYQPIGWLRTPFRALDKMPVQPPGAGGACGRIELRPDLAEGLKDLDGFSHVIAIYHFHRQADVRLSVTPFLDDRVHGLFATRAPCRPNPIGLSVLRLLQINGLLLEVEGVDMLDETPLLDIKPYVPSFDHPRSEIQTGWLESSASRVVTVHADSRFGSND
jgi:tRNA-Thr(GGU) m(6)t(6)A37 methyltransferase TsaA